MRRSFPAVGLALLAGLAPTIPAAAEDPAKPARSIRVQGNQFVDADGETVVFRGLCFPDPDKLEKASQWNARYFDEAKAWGANIVRFAVHPRAWRERGRDGYLALVDQGVEWARERDLAVILDWHSIGNLRTELYQHPMYDTTQKETFEFWRTVSERYAGDPTVIFYEIYNEPTTSQGKLGRLSWPQWKEFVEEIIGIIRAHDPTSIVLVSGRDWAYELREVVENPIDAEGVAYVSHPYPQKREQPWEPQWEADWGHVADRYPLIVTEFGFEHGGHIPTDSTPEYGHAVLDYMKKKGISWTAWCFDPDWPPQLISDWDYTPTTQGAFFRAYMLGKQ